MSSRFEAVLFDMDGVLVDSEPLWKRAEEEVFGELGVPVSEAHTTKTSRMTTQEVTDYWYTLFPWQNKSKEVVEQEVIERVIDLIIQEGVEIEGVRRLIAFLEHQHMPLGLVTNSPASVVPAVLHKIRATEVFSVICTADDVMKGKPDPEIYLKAAAALDVMPGKCLVFEDSVSGVAAAKAAGMTVVAIPPKGYVPLDNYQSADLIIPAFSAFPLDFIFD